MFETGYVTPQTGTGSVDGWYVPYYPSPYYPAYDRQGWVCAKCGASNSPSLLQCPSCPSYVTSPWRLLWCQSDTVTISSNSAKLTITNLG